MVDQTSGTISVSRKSLLDPKAPETLKPITMKKLQIIDDVQEAILEKSEELNVLKPSFPITPPRQWSRDFFRSDEYMHFAL